MSTKPKHNLVTRSAGSVSFNEEAGTVDIVYSTGARRDNGDYWETLIVSEDSIDATRLDAGAVSLIVDHMPYGLPLGRVVAHRVENGSAIATVKLSEAPENAGVVADIRAGVIRQVSVGYEQVSFEDSEEGGVRERTVTRWMPWEISLVCLPADPAAHIRSAPGAKHRRSEDKMDPEELLAAATAAVTAAAAQLAEAQEGGDADAIAAAEAAVAAAAAELEAAQAAVDAAEEGDEGGGEEETRSAPTADETRVAAVLEYATRNRISPEILTRHITQRHSLEEVQRMHTQSRADRSAPPVKTARSRILRDERETLTRQASEVIYGRIVGSTPGQDAGDLRFRSLADIAGRFVGMNSGATDPNRIFRAATAPHTRTGMHTTSDFSFAGAVATATERRVREVAANTARTYEPIVRETEVRDFKPVETISHSSFPGLLQVAEGAAPKFGTFSGEAGTFQIEEFARAIAFTFRAMVNDDLRLIDAIINSAQTAYERKRAELVFAALLDGRKLGDGKSLFHSTRGNVITSGLNEAGMEKAEEALRALPDMDGEPLNSEPAILAVGPKQAGSARRLLAPITATRSEDVNLYSGANIKLLIDPRITDMSWYLLSEADQIELASLAGYKGLQVEEDESKMLNGVTFIARTYLGAHPTGWRIGIKSTGAGQ